jgi:phospholipid transport system substrate-binding protein
MIVLKALSALPLLVWSVFALATSDAPIDVVRAATEKMLAELNARPAVRADPAALTLLVDRNIMPHVDLAGLSRLTLGKYWREATPEQRKSFEYELHTLLIRTYSASVSRYGNQGIEYVSANQSPHTSRAPVRTRITERGSSPIAVDYSLRQVHSEWKIYDVRIEGISLAVNFRGTFAEQIQSDGLDGLIARLAALNASAELDTTFVREALGQP